MKVHLDTTIQIDRIFGSDKRKSRIAEVLEGKELVTSTYVLGEYYNNMVNDYITLYHIFLQEKDIKQTGCRITEKAFGRSQGRMFKLFNDLVSCCDGDLELIEDNLDNYLQVMLARFHEGIDETLMNETECHRAKAKVVYEDGIPRLESLRCRKEDHQCEVCTFWMQRKEDLERLLENQNYDRTLKEIIEQSLQENKNFKGRNCSKLGDTVITAEAIGKKDMEVCSSNRGDFEPICESFGVSLTVPDYKNL